MANAEIVVRVAAVTAAAVEQVAEVMAAVVAVDQADAVMAAAVAVDQVAAVMAAVVAVDQADAVMAAAVAVDQADAVMAAVVAVDQADAVMAAVVAVDQAVEVMAAVVAVDQVAAVVVVDQADAVMAAGSAAAGMVQAELKQNLAIAVKVRLPRKISPTPATLRQISNGMIDRMQTLSLGVLVLVVRLPRWTRIKSPRRKTKIQNRRPKPYGIE